VIVVGGRQFAMIYKISAKKLILECFWIAFPDECALEYKTPGGEKGFNFVTNVFAWPASVE
jgi:hypothetical protein